MATSRKAQPATGPTYLRGDLQAPDYSIRVGPFPPLDALGDAWTTDLTSRWLDFEHRLTERKPVTDAEVGAMFTEAFPAAEADGYPPLVQLKALRAFFQRWQQDLVATVEDATIATARRTG